MVSEATNLNSRCKVLASTAVLIGMCPMKESAYAHMASVIEWACPVPINDRLVVVNEIKKASENKTKKCQNSTRCPFSMILKPE